ncbi:MAG: NAD-glutamate dehydrogenase, partial [Xanthobacteraceae bacterium]|nr:NAD-glutamate dehydrogenase [Xanthobacteraceae bacterium]
MLAGKRDIPHDFFPTLLGRVAPEDLPHYSAHELAVLTEASFENLKHRVSGKPKIRVQNPAPIAGAKRLQAITVIEIINDDMPFLLDSVMGELNEQGVAVRLVAHPIITVERDQNGKLLAWLGGAAASGKGQRESLIHVHVERLDDLHREKIAAALTTVLADVRVSVSDWKEMLARLHATIESLKARPPPLPAEEVAEAIAFLEWLAADNFSFLGCREYAFNDAADREMLEPAFESGLGILRGREVRVLSRSGKLVTTTPELREFMRQPVELIITKANTRSRVHRRVHLDYVGVKRFDAKGRLKGEFRIVGLFTSTAYTRATRSIPYLRRKLDKMLARAGFAPASHSGKALANVLETYPRDELFQIDDDLLYRFARQILQLEERPRVRVLARRDRFDRFVSILVYVPRERYDSAIRIRIGSFLAETYKGRLSAFYPFFPDGPLARIHFLIGRDEGATPNPDRALLEAAVERIVRNWGDGLAAAIASTHEPGIARALQRRYCEAFSAGYREAFTPEAAVGDIHILETLTPDNPIAVGFYRRDPGTPERAQLKILSHGRPIPLSARVPVLENMGFTVVDERTYTVEAKGENSKCTWLHDMLLGRKGGGAIDLETLASPLEACLMALAREQAENDGYNALVLAAGMPWRDVALVRTLSRYLRQARVPFSQDYLWTTLTRHAPVAAKIVELFHARFDPRLEIEPVQRAVLEAAIVAEIESALAAVESLDEDRILRRFVNLVTSAVRTNFYQIDADGQMKPTISIKFESRKIEELPAPRPLYEIFVYSPRVEGVHLRFGKVARGGIRWSDRPQDFRTEVLGLVKAQQVKNTVIVPVGSKGGFVPKKLPAGGAREAILTEGTAAYEIFIASLLEITDNIGPQGIVAPANVVRHDDDDPNHVVAADKGTATYTDTANGNAI